MAEELIKQFFKINEDIELTKEEEEFKIQLEEELSTLLQEEGEVGEIRIKEIVLDMLLKYEYTNLMKYLNLEIPQSVGDNLERNFTNQDFLKYENAEDNQDFFNQYLQDVGINDLIMSLKGYEKKSEGKKEIFIKKRGAIIPTDKIDAINRILISKFNPTEFKSKKDDNEQAQMLKFILEEIFEILLEIPNEQCNTEKTIEIMTMCSIKLMNAVGLLTDLRKELMETAKESMKSQRNQNVNNQQQLQVQ